MDGLRICFREPAFDGRLHELSDREFLKAVVWDGAAPPTLTKPARQGDVSTFCRWLQNLRFGAAGRGRRKTAVSNQAFQKPSLWSLEAFETPPTANPLVRFWNAFPVTSNRSRRKMGVGDPRGQDDRNAERRSPRSRNGRDRLPLESTNGERDTLLLEWLNAVESPLSPLESLIVHEILRDAGHELPVEACWSLWRTALTAALEFHARTSRPRRDNATADRRLVLDGELPWQFGLLFGDLHGADQVGRAGQRELRKQLLDRTDTDGTPEAGLLERLPFWLAPLVRSAQWAERFRTRLWDEESAERFRALLKIVVPLCRSDRQLALSHAFRDDTLDLLTSALRLAGWTSRSRPMKYLLEVGNGDAQKGARSTSHRLSADRAGRWPVTQSDWARLACLRSAWSVDADSLVVAHHRPMPIIELVTLGEPLLKGVWDIAVTADGKPVRFEGQWSCTCWFSDHDADYLELQINVGNGVQVDRQVLLSRTDHFALLADSVSGAAGRRIEYTSRLPLAGSVEVQPDTATRECLLKAPRRRARVFPLALPSDRVMSTPGAFGPSGEALELQQTAIGGLYAPVVIDWDPRRRRSYADWRILTVTEQRRILKSEAAAGHRLRVGNHQLLIYRSLSDSEDPRAVLGHHTAHETVIGRFDPDGDLDPIIEVESE